MEKTSHYSDTWWQSGNELIITNLTVFMRLRVTLLEKIFLVKFNWCCWRRMALTFSLVKVFLVLAFLHPDGSICGWLEVKQLPLLWPLGQQLLQASREISFGPLSLDFIFFLACSFSTLLWFFSMASIFLWSLSSFTFVCASAKLTLKISEMTHLVLNKFDLLLI